MHLATVSGEGTAWGVKQSYQEGISVNVSQTWAKQHCEIVEWHSQINTFLVAMVKSAGIWFSYSFSMLQALEKEDRMFPDI